MKTLNCGACRFNYTLASTIWAHLAVVTLMTLTTCAAPAAGQTQTQDIAAQQGRYFLRDFKPAPLPRIVGTSRDSEIRSILAKSRNRDLPDSAWVAESALGEKAAAVPVLDDAGEILRRSIDGQTITALWDVMTDDRVVHADVDVNAATMGITRFTLRDMSTGEGLELNPSEGRVYRLSSKVSPEQSVASGTIACILNDLGTLALPCEASILVSNMSACIVAIAAAPETAGISAILGLPACGAVLGTLEQALLCAGTDCGLATLTRPYVAQAIIQPQYANVQLSTAGRQYLFAMDTGGGKQSGLFTNGQFAEVTDATGFLSAGTAYGTSSSNNFNTNSSYFTIGGVSVAGTWNSFIPISGSNSTPGASSASATFTLTQPSLVVVMAMASSQDQIQLSGVSGLQVDASSVNTPGIEPMVIAHAYLTPGTYTVTEATSAAGLSGQNINNMADLIAVYIFGY